MNEIRDLAVPFITYARRTLSRHALAVGDGHTRHPQGGRGELEDNGWVSLRWTARCRGKHLLLRIESPDASAGDALTVWTYPRYYDGEISQRGNPRITGRSLGLTLNALSAGLISE